MRKYEAAETTVTKNIFTNYNCEGKIIYSMLNKSKNEASCNKFFFGEFLLKKIFNHNEQIL